MFKPIGYIQNIANKKINVKNEYSNLVHTRKRLRSKLPQPNKTYFTQERQYKSIFKEKVDKENGKLSYT
jgi:hypothetical protein